ncbi:MULTISPECIES: hypothetical protein [unclassified Cryobacterium]|uniref:hypothetical protein n=1 Tax=unclassified Cryobacterium TaxID=2649013 RepID=UPI00106909A2|nr:MULTISPECIES: hypothetical protein [unclassified Cryobacterium]TFC59275.1 hypothetical protein E3O60_09790 [Cryobacterium sp. TMB1-7]TFC86758.1 hypothetical protein E3T19_14265 [Cryobacterium sp. TMT4-31]
MTQDPTLAAPAVEPSSAPTPHPRTRRTILTTLAVLLAVAVGGGGFWGWGAAAQDRYETATSALTAQVGEETDARNASDARSRNLVWLAERIRAVAATPAFAADALPEADALREILAELEPVIEASDTAEAIRPPANDEPVSDNDHSLPWQAMAEAERIEGLTGQSQSAEDRLRASAQAATTGRDDLDAAEAAYFTAAATRAEQTIVDNRLSNRSVQVPLIRLIEYARDPAMSSARDAVFLTSMTDAEAQVRSSEAIHQAEAHDPAWAVRREIEAYARSLSNGIALEFIWAPEVSGLGADWLSGTAETYDSDGGWSIISLNYTIENVWYEGSDAHAVVAHEVGHTQVYRENCWPLFSGSAFSQDQEAWATAWSISQGFDEPGSGIEAYGRPTDEQIAVAGTCR